MPSSKEKVPGTLRKISGKFQTEGNETRGDANEFVPNLGILLGDTSYGGAIP